MCNGFNNVIIMLYALCVRVYATASYIRTTVERRDETGSRFESKNVNIWYSSRSIRKLTRISDIIDLGRHNVCGWQELASWWWGKGKRWQRAVPPIEGLYKLARIPNSAKIRVDAELTRHLCRVGAGTLSAPWAYDGSIIQ